MDSVLNIDNAIKLLQVSLAFTMERIDDWQSVVPEGKALSNECKLFQSIIEDVVGKPDLPISGILQDVNKTLTETNELIEAFIANDSRTDRSFFSKAGWKLMRPISAHDHRAIFKSATEHLQASKKKIEETLALSAQVNTPTAHRYRGDMVNHESFVFWKDTCGEALHAPSWSIFVETYQQRYNEEWDK